MSGSEHQIDGRKYPVEVCRSMDVIHTEWFTEITINNKIYCLNYNLSGQRANTRSIMTM